MLLEGKVAIITGATRGIGKAISLTFAKQGARLIINGRNAELLEEVKKEVEALGSECVSVQGDITNPSTANKLIENAINKYNAINILVNNAGIISRTPLEKMSDEDWYKVIDINLNGTFILCKEILSYMKKQRSGKIVNIASSAAKKPHPNAAPSYGASKAGVVYLTRHFALNMAKYGIYVNAVCPGPVETDMSKQWDEEYKKNVLKKIPLGRIGKAEEVANVALFLASSMSDFITGEAININGGSFMD